MAKKLTIEFISADFLRYKYILLTKIYINNLQKLEYICPEGHRHFITWKNWKTGQRCPTCNNNNKKHTIEFVRESFEDSEFILITKKYINAKQKLECICPKGHRHFITWGHWQQGTRCPTCANDSQKFTIKFIIKDFKKNKYILITKEYINSKQKLYYICPEGHRHSMTWGDWQQGKRCPTCANNYKRLGITIIKKEFEKDTYNLLTTEYINSFKKLEYICPEGHRHSMTWNNWRQGRRCPTCWAIKNFGKESSGWKGGISKEPYCKDWTKDLKEFIKERDDYKCMNPDCLKKDDMLHVHHINYNKKSCGPENLITVCRSCNSRANSDREWHESWYKAILYRRYGYI